MGVEFHHADVFKQILTEIPDIWIAVTDLEGAILFSNFVCPLSQDRKLGIRACFSEASLAQLRTHHQTQLETCKNFSNYPLVYTLNNSKPMSVTVSKHVINDDNDTSLLSVYVLKNLPTRDSSSAKLKEMTKSLSEKTDILERFNRLAVDRELEMMKLKQEINVLHVKLGKKPKYKMFQDGFKKTG
jgi:hypothetical protein